jgi:hypothetical protein
MHLAFPLRVRQYKVDESLVFDKPKGETVLIELSFLIVTPVPIAS